MLLGCCNWARDMFLEIIVLLNHVAHRLDRIFLLELLVVRKSVQDLCEVVNVSSLENTQ